MTYQEIYPGINTFVMAEVRKTPIGGGRFHREYTGADYIPTPGYGLLSEADWLKLAMRAIGEREETGLFLAVLDHISCLAFMRRKDREYRNVYAARCVIEGSW